MTKEQIEKLRAIGFEVSEENARGHITIASDTIQEMCKMKRINDYWLFPKQQKVTEHKMSLCGKLEAMIGNYFLYGAGIPDNDIEVLYYDPTVGLYDEIPLVKENIIAYIVHNESVAFVRKDMFVKFKEDTEEYELIYVPVSSFEQDEFYIDREMEIPPILQNMLWVDDDFMNDENIEFDFEAFEIIDSNMKYINPKHFSVSDLINALRTR